MVDEAGQLALADAVAATNGARNMILLGDPLQLSQVAKAEHPGRRGRERPAACSRRAPDHSQYQGRLHRRDLAHASRCLRFISRRSTRDVSPVTRVCAHREPRSARDCAGSRRRTPPLDGVARRGRARRRPDRRMIGTPWTNRGRLATPLARATSWWSPPTTTRSTCCASFSKLIRALGSAGRHGG